MFRSTRMLILLAIVAGIAMIAGAAIAVPVTYSFDDIAAGDHLLSGVHGGIDFGTGLWRSYSPAWNGLTNTAYFDYTGGQSGSSRVFILPSSKVLKSIRLTSDAGGTYTIGDGVNTDVSGSVDNTFGGILVTTGWTTNAATITVTLSAKDYAGIDDITYDAAGAPTYSVSGYVQDTGSNRIAGATVSVSGGASTTTDSAGNYSVAVASTGTYSITASKANYYSSTASVTVSGSSTTQNFTLTPNPVVTGYVQDASSNRLKGATVYVTGGASAITDSTGNYSVAVASNGTYTLTASKANYYQQTASVAVSGSATHNFTLTAYAATNTWDVNTDFGTTNPSGAWTYGSSATAPSAGYTFDASVSGVAWQYPSGSSMFSWYADGSHISELPGNEWYTWVGKNRTTAFADNGNWVTFPADKFIMMHDLWNPNPRPVVRWTAPVAGYYTVAGTLSMPYSDSGMNFYVVTNGSVVAAHGLANGGTSYSFSALVHANVDDTVDSIAYGPSASNVGVLDLHITTGGQGIAGVVQDTSANNIAGATVQIGSSTTVTDAAGAYSMGLPGGTYTVSVSKRGYVSGSASVVVSGSVPVTQNFSLTPLAPITGTVTDSAAAPLEGVKVQIIGGDTQYTDAAGQYTLYASPGTYTVKASLRTYMPAQKSVTAPNTPPDADFVLNAAPTVTGTVYISGTPVEGATVEIVGGDMTTTDSAGNYLLYADGPGTFTGKASRTTYSPNQHSVTAPGTGQNFTLTAKPVNASFPFNLSADFSITNNPNGAWKYGYKASSPTGSFTQLPTVFSANPIVSYWGTDGSRASAKNAPGRLYVNMTASPVEVQDVTSAFFWFDGFTAYFEPSMVIAETGYYGSANNRAVARWTSPATGIVHVYAKFNSPAVPPWNNYEPDAYQHCEVVKNSSTLLCPTQILDGFAGRSANGYADSVGPNPVYEFETIVPVVAGDTVDFQGGGQHYVAMSANIDVATSYGTISGYVRANTAGNPALSGATVSVPGTAFAAVTGADGSYSLLVPPGTYAVAAGKTWFATSTVTGASVSNGGTTTRNFNLDLATNDGVVVTSMSSLKAQSVGTKVYMITPVVAASATSGAKSFNKAYGAPLTDTDYFFVQTEDRVAGVKCYGGSVLSLFAPGDKMTMIGQIINDPATGLKAVQVQSALSAGATTATLFVGKNGKANANTSTLVKIWGKVTQLQANTLVPPEDDGAGHLKWNYEYMIINDGSQDVKIPLHVQLNWMSTIDPTFANLIVGHYVAVTGIATTTNGSDVVVMPRNVSDIWDYTGL